MKDEGKSIGTIKFGKFVPEKMYKVNFTADDKVMATFAKYGLKKIEGDKEALVSYAINCLLLEMIEREKAEYNLPGGRSRWFKQLYGKKAKKTKKAKKKFSERFPNGYHYKCKSSKR